MRAQCQFLTPVAGFQRQALDISCLLVGSLVCAQSGQTRAIIGTDTTTISTSSGSPMRQ